MSVVDRVPLSRAEGALLLALSRGSVKEKNLGRLRDLCDQITDWQSLYHVAFAKMSAPFVYRNLKTLYNYESIPGHEGYLKNLALRQQMATLKVMSAARRFHTDCIEALAVPHAYIKGPALASMFYVDPGLRYSRDIDVLVSADHFASIIRCALHKGYRVVGNPESGRQIYEEQDLRAAIRYNDVVSVISPSGICIEVHKKIDKENSIFPTDDLLRRAVPVSFGGVEAYSLSCEDMFCFACYHNTRHLWSNLHWLADLSTMLEGDKLDLEKSKRMADGYGLSYIVNACIEFDELAEFGEPPKRLETNNGSKLFDICLRNLAGNVDWERRLRQETGDMIIPLDETTRFGSWERKISTLLKRSRPTFDQYEELPLPDVLQWLYYPLKPYRALKKRLL